MKKLPIDVSSYKRTPTFTQDTIPPGLQKAHSTKVGTWGKIIVVDGHLLYRILEPAVETHHLDQTTIGIVEPTVLHEVEAMGAVEFYVEFFRAV